ncbi:PASTA domain-containing protein [Bacillus sp. FJAT-42376]|uniref:penicillin-binding transpeptidase domain-containing protein n=1 Tax=Bacillus sp. FJAT-42376 TaxID=2014076 RepID=UPI000F50A76B|nr:penicillin-binding transpeptidase domain-containing protein [Bacillus sp. FJAT-42376]AZB42835.1 PASTA domain-containing protein [Bacillus sp. FJAT-42376]
MLKKNKNMNRGAAVIATIFAALFFIITGRFLYIQLTGQVDGQVLAARAAQKYEEKQTLEASRGSILDRNGEAIAEDTSAYTLVAILDKSLTTNAKHPQHVIDKEKTAEKLAPILKIGVSDAREILEKDAKQVEFGADGRNLSQTEKMKIEKLKLPGIAFIKNQKRFYPNGLFASHIIGYAQKDEETGRTSGMMGLEKSLDSYLQEKDGSVKFKSDHYGWKLPGSRDKITPPDNGSDVYLTLDQKIQTFLEDAMNQAVKDYNPKKVMAVVADPKTGKILAMSQRPSFNPNKRDISNFTNDIIGYPIEPGSTMKIYTVAAAIEQGVYSGSASYKSGSYKIGNKVIKDHNKTGWGSITFDEGFERSSNVAMINLAMKLGPDAYSTYMEKFGFGEKTGIDLPGEKAGKINSDSKISLATASFGQGSTATVIEQIQAATAVANGGRLMKPYLIDQIVDKDSGKVIRKNEPKQIGKPISEATAAQVRDLMGKVVSSKNGTGKPFAIEGYEVAGKTGTAQIPGENGRYMSGKENFIFSFMGMAPKDDPELLVYVAVQQPELEPTEVGSMPTSSIFKTVMQNSLQYLQIQPEEKKEADKQKRQAADPEMESFVGKTAKDSSRLLESGSYKPVILGSGPSVQAQSPSERSVISKGEKIFLYTGGKAKMPDLTGWSKRDIMKLADLLNLRVSFSGEGFSAKQSIPKGTMVSKETLLTVELKP